ncbi:MAG: histidine kinase, partial [Microbacteriaceae bacterium]|nr:histidine kinase [Microbacteriaceae bacterium]
MANPWRTLLMGLPQRRFTPAELQRTIPEPPGAALCAATVLNALLLAGAVVIAAGTAHSGRVGWFVVPYVALHLWALWWVWRDPGSRWGRGTYYLAPIALGISVGLARDALEVDLNRSIIFAIAMVAMVLSLALWFAIVYRHKFVEMRLKELDERERAIDMARQLAAAQIQPHFLFNSLASLQHWVQTKDDRAAPLLEALTGYLRATLPLFNREQLALGDEAVAVERYLQVMQMRLGDKLRFTIDLPPSTQPAQVPPGLLLTLVENAVEHGIAPA